MTHEAQQNNFENSNSQEEWTGEFGYSMLMDSEELRANGFTEEKLQKMAEYAEPPSGNEIETSTRLKWLIWYYGEINKNDEKFHQYKNLERDHRKGKDTILSAVNNERKKVAENSNSNNVSTSKLENSDSEETIEKSLERENKTSQYLEIVDYLMKDEKLQADNFSKLTISQVNDLTKHLDDLKSNDEVSYYRFFILIAETNHIYRDTEKNNSIENPNFEKLVEHIANDAETLISEMSLDLDRFKTIQEIVEHYKKEENPDKKRFILDHTQKTFNSIEDKKYMEKHISKKSLNDLEAYKTSTEYKIINQEALIGGHTAADILRQSPEETQRMNKSFMEAGFDTIKHPFIITGAILVYLFGGFNKMKGVSTIPGMNSFLGRIGLGIAGAGLYLSGRDTGLWDSFRSNSESSLKEVTNQKEIGDKFHAVNRILRSSVDGRIINSPDASELSRLIMVDNTLNNIHLSKVRSFLETGGITAAELFGSEESIPEKPNTEGEKYTTDELKEYFTHFVAMSDEGDSTIKDVFNNEVTADPSPRLADVTPDEGTTEADERLADVTPDEGTTEADERLADVTPDEGTTEADERLADVTPSEETNTDDTQSLADVTEVDETEDESNPSTENDGQVSEEEITKERTMLEEDINDDIFISSMTSVEVIEGVLDLIDSNNESFFLEGLNEKASELIQSTDEVKKDHGRLLRGYIITING